MRKPNHPNGTSAWSWGQGIGVGDYVGFAQCSSTSL